ncbi:CPBP family intramembrane glutamic endopeptidase [Fodinicola acaciae]|uniref:CPBP family intramembrane glutamic endopeptidase n=1 Tax=Fodinicola acaciae TaxID=2681555 RepID=UPI0013D0D024|nr:CPBP family intramembrane glutamic endopeptidase [Fodinicola acaciae]
MTDEPWPRRVLGTEVLLVLGVSLGASAITSVLSIISRLTASKALADQHSTLNPSITPDRPWLDLAYQLVSIGLGVVPALLAIHLLDRTDPPALATIGLNRGKLGGDLGWGAVLAACIGVPGLALYAVARAIGVNTTVVPEALGAHWWSVPVLILSAAQNAFLEEVVVVGYLLTRMERMRISLPWILAASAVLRGSYHLYQGFGGFAGNLVMGLVFAAVFLRFRRVAPLVVAHTILDIVAFVGYALLKPFLPWLS